MKRTLLFLLFALSLSYLGWGQIISQYVETNSGSTPKGIEIWNNTGSTLDFSTNNLIIQQGTNGGVLTDKVTISSGTLVSGAVLVIGTTDIGTYLTSQSLGVSFTSFTFDFNGDDALAVKYGSITTDLFGNPGYDPGSAWTGNSVSTANQNIALNTGITSGASAWTDPSLRFSTISTTPVALPAGLSGFGIAPTTSSTTITLAPTTLTGFTYIEGSGPSSEQTFTVSGSNLTADISLAASTNYEISKTSGSGYSTPLTFSQVSGTVEETTVYVRLKAGLSAGDYNGEVITASSNGADNKTVTCSGSVGTPPDPEPTNHPTAFNASAAGATQINLTWSDNDGAQAADGFLIVGKTGVGTFYEPVDGTEPSNDTEWSDNNFEVKVAHGVQSYSVTGLTPSTQYDFKIYPYTNSGANINYKTNGTVPTANATTEVILLTPTATAATNVSPTGFTANWGAVAGATSYEIDVYTITGGGTTTIFSENFNGFTAGSTGSGANGTDVSASLNSYTQTPGWTGSKIYQAGGTVKMGTSSGLGYIVTPEIDLSGNGGAFNLAFESMAWSGDATDLKIYLNGSLVHTVTGLNNSSSYTLSPFTIPLTGGTSTSKIKFEGKQASNGRFFLENLVITQGGTSSTPIAGSPFTENSSTSKAISGLVASTNYYYVVRAKTVSQETANSNEIEVTTGAYKITVGAGIWNSNVWSPAGTPVSKDDVTINHVVTIDDLVECNNLTIAPGGAVTVGASPDQGLSVNGNMLIQSDASGTGSFIGDADDYDITGTVTVQRYINGAADAWHLLSSPVTGQAISGEWTPSGSYPDASGYDLYAYDEATNTYVNRKNTIASPVGVGPRFDDPSVNNGLNFLAGKGYMCAYETVGTAKIFSGTLNEGIFYTDLSKEGSSVYAGANLVGNPYPSSIDWKASPSVDLSGVRTETGGGKQFYTWNEGANNYGVYNNNNAGNNGTNGASRFIAPMQAFWVMAAEDGGDLGFDNDSRVHSSQAWLKTAEATNPTLVIRATAPGQNGYDEAMVEFNHESSVGGATKRFSFVATAPSLYLEKNTEKFSISFLTDVATNPEIPVSFKAGIDGSYTLAATQGLENFERVTLHDLATGTTQELLQNPVYPFSASTTDAPNRFKLTFGS
ncbi:MAG: fibronectin type III domain-containing protein, partial [Bacteroidales bacterium]|nr:fibronectin type III domain-containing protein [Bacteroidales bacterium]MDD3666814.1 fibronectin type III domain-containing protein [Bacteroidales bacterium]